MSKQKRTKGQMNPIGRLTEVEYEQMFMAYCERPTIKHICDVTGISERVATKYVSRGDPRRNWPPIRKRYEDYLRGIQQQTKFAVERLAVFRHKQTRQMVTQFYTNLIDEKGTGLSIPKDWMTPGTWIGLTTHELKLREIAQKETAEEEAGKRFQVDFADPRMALLFKQRLKDEILRFLGAGVRETVHALDPDGSKGLTNRLPPLLNLIAELNPEQPEAQQAVLRLAESLGIGTAMREATLVHDVEVEDADPEASVVDTTDLG